MEKEKITIKDEYITLSQLLKLANIFESGGFIKNYLQDVGVHVNEKLEHRRGRKLYNGDTVNVENQIILQVVSEK